MHTCRRRFTTHAMAPDIPYTGQLWLFTHTVPPRRGSSLAIAPHSVVSAPQVGNLGLQPLILEQCPCEHGVPHLLVDVGLRIGGALPLVLLVDVGLRIGGALPLVLLRISFVLGRKRLLGSRVKGLG